jgi:hypothetical protein
MLVVGRDHYINVVIELSKIPFGILIGAGFFLAQGT